MDIGLGFLLLDVIFAERNGYFKFFFGFVALLRSDLTLRFIEGLCVKDKKKIPWLELVSTF